MSITVSFKFDNIHQASEFLSTCAPDTSRSTIVNATTLASEPEKKRGRKKATPVPDGQPAPTEVDVQNALTKVFDTKGINVARDLLSRYGVKRAIELKPDSYAKFIAYTKRVLEGETV